MLPGFLGVAALACVAWFREISALGRRLNRTAYRPDRRPDSARPATVVTDHTGAVMSVDVD